MSKFRTKLNVSEELCDKCSKPMTVEEPGITIKTSFIENGKVEIWAHIECLQQMLYKARKEHLNAVRSL